LGISKIKKYNYLFILLYFLFSTKQIVGQNGFNYNLKSTQNIEISPLQADRILLKIEDREKKVKKAFELSRIFYKQKKLDLAIKYAKIQNTILLDLNIFPKHYHTSFYLIGKYFMEDNNLDSAKAYFKKSININYYPKKRAQSLCQLAICFRMQGKLYESYEYYKEGITSLIKYGKANSIIYHILNLADVCNQIKSIESAQLGINFLKKCDSLLKINKEVLDEKGPIDMAKGVLYTLDVNYNFKLASNYYRKALINCLKTGNKRTISLCYLNLSELYLKENKDSTLFFLKKSLEYGNLSESSLIKDVLSETYRNLSIYNLKNNNISEAYFNINNSLKKSFEITLSKNIFKIKESAFKRVSSRRNVFLSFKEKLNILNILYNKTGQVEYLNESIKTVSTCDAFINYTIQNSTEINTKFLWRDDVSNIYNYGVLAAYNLGDNELMNSIIEKNKAFLLTQSIKENNSQLNLPYQIKTQLKKYQEDIFSLEEKSEENKKIKDSLFNIKLTFDRFKDSISKVYPEYFSKRNNIQPISLEKMKENLNDKAVILSYHLDSNNNNLFGLFTSKKDNYTFKAKIDSSFNKLVNNYKKLISKPLTQKSEFKDFYGTSNKLFNHLFPDKKSRDFINGKNLIILSNDVLQNIPFESLNSNNESPNYLIEDHNISYAYSASFLDFNNSLKRETSKNLAAFAPVSFFNSELKSLQATEAEVKTISNEISSDLFTNINATKTNFLNNSSDYKILHLATHATSSDNPAIYFSKDTLKLHELYTHKTNADLVVLSACESNLGEIKKGEGVFSLSRGFFYSGAKSVISSLWNVNDVSTSSIMKDFYKNLNNNQSKSEALNNAKRNYLKEHSLSEKSPYYWASFVLIGDTSPTYPATPFWVYILGIVILFSIILFFFKKRG
jgi:CHAT domain-containing protein